MTGYTQTELEDVQAKWNLRFPPDLLALLRENRFVIDRGENNRSFDWINAEPAQIRDCLDWPFEGFLFDVQNGLWWPEWGDTPKRPDDRETRLREIFETVPKLIPVYGHRYIPSLPNEVSNPIFSVWQMDVVHYGASLADYILRETSSYPGNVPETPFKTVPFWSRAVEFNIERFKNGGGFAFLNKESVLPEDS